MPELIAPTSEVAFNRIMKNPTILISFLNSILEQENVVIVKIQSSNQVLSSALGPVQQSSEQPRRASTINSVRYATDEHPGSDDLNQTVRYDLVVVTDKDIVINIEMQKVKQHFYLDRMAYYSSRVVCDNTHEGPQTLFHSNNQLNPNTHPATVENCDYKCPPIYVISMCGFAWTALTSIPVELHQDWLLWLAPHWKVGSNRPKRSDNVPAILQNEPTVQHVFISLPTACQHLGQQVNDILEQLIWIFANVGPKSHLEELPKWVRTNKPASLLMNQITYNSLTIKERIAYQKSEKRELEYEKFKADETIELAKEITARRIEAKLEAKRVRRQARLEEERKRAEAKLKADQGKQDAEIEELKEKLRRHGDL
ncbi:hypothetical protein PtA15_2A625 [Puccinia triticina]|uniref:PD-(D/E)XK nuclease family transposase n=1 Tax=Puccinia triticina TaxID=208348 RepID=A0ABY7CBM3_9BASI|nr:uncharacterized protein PtA15_2A625 [Puccinia triticina]WAQ82308.1 hypothetical protein PtA15_2A625 [Puccinia triticina]